MLLWAEDVERGVKNISYQPSTILTEAGIGQQHAHYIAPQPQPRHRIGTYGNKSGLPSLPPLY
jgi:hypothetical protein